MALAEIVSAKQLDDSRVEIVVESADQEATLSHETRGAALTKAAQWLARPGINSTSGPYAVGPDGAEITSGPAVPGMRFRVDYVCRGGL